ncbi:MAG: hypothetical protein JOZ52_08570, partial [Acidobacteria bacterium]|nr:hypothetical protein [Acidobacteriota bacterium]
FVELKQDTEVDVLGAENDDQLAEALAHNQKIYAEHRESLTHEETVERTVDGETKQVRVRVSYGVGGTRQEEILGEGEQARLEAGKLVVDNPPPAKAEGDEPTAFGQAF